MDCLLLVERTTVSRNNQFTVRYRYRIVSFDFCIILLAETCRALLECPVWFRPFYQADQLITACFNSFALHNIESCVRIQSEIMSGGAKRKRGVNTLNADLRREFPFLRTTKSDSEVRCGICNVEFDISHSGKANITSHINSDRHKKALSAAATENRTCRYSFCHRDYWRLQSWKCKIVSSGCSLLLWERRCRYNIKMTCLEFFDFIKTQPKLLEKIGNDDKYAFKTKNWLFKS